MTERKGVEQPESGCEHSQRVIVPKTWHRKRHHADKRDELGQNLVDRAYETLIEVRKD